jgi:predicted DNA-binding antitoxin AbrB/MazE fold protein
LGDYANLPDLVDACAEFYCSHAERQKAETLETRQHLADWIHKFHCDAGTLTSQVEEALKKLLSEKCLLLMTAHQPNLFAYAGVLRKATLNHVLADRLSESLDVPVVTFFGLADQDLTDNRWVRSAQVPDGERRNGILELRVALPEKMMLNRTRRPSHVVLDKWQRDLDDWIHRKTKTVTAFLRGLGVQPDPAAMNEYSANLEQFWSYVTEAYERARTYSDFNSFVISQVISSVCGYDTLFCRFSECQSIFRREFKLLMRDFRVYSQALHDALATSQSEEGGVYNDEWHTIPVWYHCDCGSKVRLAATEIEPNVIARGTCIRCGEEQGIDFSQNSEIWDHLDRVSARALAMPLVFFGGLHVTCYVGGIGGREYLRQAKHVAGRMGIAFPPIVIWRPRDRYLGLAQLEALLTLGQASGTADLREGERLEIALRERLSKIQEEIEQLESRKKNIANSEIDHTLKVEKTRALSEQQNELRRRSNLAFLARQLRLVDNAKRVMDLHPCMVDYAVNLGLRSALEQWEAFLNNVGDLNSSVNLRTNLDRHLPGQLVQSYWASQAGEVRHDKFG